jgi:hypothetical protein
MARESSRLDRCFDLVFGWPQADPPCPSRPRPHSAAGGRVYVARRAAAPTRADPTNTVVVSRPTPSPVRLGRTFDPHGNSRGRRAGAPTRHVYELSAI